MIRLAIETSTMTQSVAVQIDGQIVAERLCRRQAGHSSSLLSTVEGALQDVGTTIQNIDAIICGLGPGSFTGVRVGLSFAQGVAAGLGVPVYGVDSFQAFLPYLPPNVPIAVALDARKAEVYGVIYGSDRPASEALEANTFAPSDFFERVASHADPRILLVGDGPDAFPDLWAPYQERITRISQLCVPLAAGLFDALDHGQSRSASSGPLEPRYIRPSDAEKTRDAAAS